jgi:hypothetical protein
MNFYLVLAIDPVSTQIFMVSISDNLEEIKKDQQDFIQEVDHAYIRTFIFDLEDQDIDLGKEIYNWLIKCGITTSEAVTCVHSIGRSITKLLDKSRKI